MLGLLLLRVLLFFFLVLFVALVFFLCPGLLEDRLRTVHHVLGSGGFFLERFVQKIGNFLHAERFRHRNRGGVAGNLVMLDAQCSTCDAGVFQ